MREVNGDEMRWLEKTAREIGGIIGGAAQRESTRYGFALMLFSFDGPEFTWISNAQRQDMLKMLKEFIARCESGEANQTWEARN